MSKLLAYLFLVSAGFGISLGNYWFTYGLWPRSWVSFTVFLVLSLTTTAMYQKLRDEE